MKEYIVHVPKHLETNQEKIVSFFGEPIIELIRCKDCKYNSNTEGNYVNCGIIPQMFGKTPDDNYCSWAEREPDEHRNP